MPMPTPDELALAGAREQINVQSATLDDVRTRSSTLLTGIALVAALLGPPVFELKDALDDGWTQLGLVAALAALCCIGAILLPVWKWRLVMNDVDIYKLTSDSPRESLTPRDLEAILTEYGRYRKENSRRLETMMNLLIAAGALTLTFATCWLVEIARRA